VHVGYLVGFLLGAQVGSSRPGWTAAVIALAAAMAFAVGLALLPDQERATARMQRTYRARARRVLALTAALMDPAADARAARRRARRLRRRVVRLNETCLVLDVRLAQAPHDSGDAARRCSGTEGG